MTTKKHEVPDSRQALLAAASDEFALNGFDGASVETIAARAGVNKAMIYYHFRSKQGLYEEIVRAAFSAMGERTAAIVRSPASANEKLAALVKAVGAETHARPYLPPIMMREMAEGARRLDKDTLQVMSRVFSDLRDILDQGVRQGVFRDLDPLFAYLSLISPILFFRTSSALRASMARYNLVQGLTTLDQDLFLADLTNNLIHAFAADSASAKRAGKRQRTARSARIGEHV